MVIVKSKASITLVCVDDGADGISIDSITRYYRVSETLPTDTPLLAPSDWELTEPEYEERYEYVQVTAVASGEDVPDFETDTYYSYDSALSEYVLLEEVPGGEVWSNIYTSYYIREAVDDNLYYCDVYEWSDGGWTCSEISISSTYAMAKQAMEDIDNTNKRIDGESGRISDLGEGLNGLEGDIVIINNDTVPTIMEDITSLQARSDYTGHITVNDNPPSISLGKQTEDTKWSTEITSEGVTLKNGSTPAGQFMQNEKGESVMKSNNAVIATAIFRSADGGGGVLGLVAQSNGHLSLKEV